jgi:Zn-dependent protease with chaperone function
VLARGEADETDEKQDASRVEGLLRHLTPRVPSIAIIEDEDYVLYSSTGKMRRIVVSSGVVEVLTNDELQAALAHELAHMERSERPLLAIAFVLRACQFFNPVVLFEFRRMAREEEQICDDMAVAATRKPRALGAALRKLYHVPEKARASDVVRVADFKKSLEEYGHGVELRSRIKRLERGSHPPDDRHWLAFISTIIVVSAVTYFVV